MGIMGIMGIMGVMGVMGIMGIMGIMGVMGSASRTGNYGSNLIIYLYLCGKFLNFGVLFCKYKFTNFWGLLF